jgi:hypothetical protein
MQVEVGQPKPEAALKHEASSMRLIIIASLEVPIVGVPYT